MRQVNTFAEYMADEERISAEDRAAINLEAAIIGKIVEAREKKGLSQPRRIDEKLGKLKSPGSLAAWKREREQLPYHIV